MKHAVVLTSYNRPRFVAEAIASVLVQTRPTWQLIISDDGSTPETLESVHRAVKGDPRVEILMFSREQGSPSPFQRHVDTNNRALARVAKDVDLVHYLADDDQFVPKRFERFEEMFVCAPESVCCYGRLIYISVDGTPNGSLYCIADWIAEPLNSIDQGQFAHRRSVLDTFPAWDPAIDTAADGQWMNKLWKRWGKFTCFDVAVSKKRVHNRNMQFTGGAADRETPSDRLVSDECKRRYD